MVITESPMDRAAATLNAMESEDVKAWRTQRSRPVVTVTEAAQQAFVRLWFVALVDAEAQRVQDEAERADAA